MTAIAAALLAILALGEPTVEWRVETESMPHSPTLYPDAIAPAGVLVAAGKDVLLLDSSGAIRWKVVFDVPIATCITAADLDGDGAGFWVYKYDDLFWPLESAHWSVVYPTNDDVVPSRRWEAVRDGQEDYRLLYEFDKEIARIRAVGQSDAAQRAEELLNEAVENVAGWQVGQIDEITRQTRDYEVDFDLLNTYRDRITGEIVRLRELR